MFEMCRIWYIALLKSFTDERRNDNTIAIDLPKSDDHLVDVPVEVHGSSSSSNSNSGKILLNVCFKCLCTE